MRILSRKLNNGETFPCSFLEAKRIFKDTDTVLNFSKFGRDFGTFANTPDRFYVKHNIKGRVIAAAYMHPKRKEQMISFYVLKVNDYTDGQRKLFESEYLPEFYKLYESMRFSNENISITHMLLVELVDKKFIIHKMSYH